MVGKLNRANRLKYLGPSKLSSFQGWWKLTSERRTKFSSPVAWLDVKRHDDDIDPCLWRVHDKLYDLSSFINRHPGGREFIQISQGTDITELFESSHFVNVSLVEKTLKTFYVKDAKTPRNSPYTFHEDGFYKTLKRKIEPVLKKEGTNSTRSMKLLQDLLVLSTLLIAALGTCFQSYFLILMAGILLGMSSVGAHNFMHLKDNWRKYYFDLCLFGHYEWRITHVLSHHPFPNTVLDAETTYLEPFVNFLPIRSKNWMQRYGSWIYCHLVYFMGFFMALIFKINYICQGKINPRPEHALVFLQLFLLVFYSPSWTVGLKFWLILHGVCSYWVIFTGLTAAHHHPTVLHDGDETRPNPDFGLCQLDVTSVKIEDEERNLLQLVTTFGAHNLHHLFPTICASKLHHLKPVLAQTLKEFQEEFTYLSAWQLFMGTHNQLARVQPRSFQEFLDQRNRNRRSQQLKKKKN